VAGNEWFFKFTWKITFNTKYVKYVVFCAAVRLLELRVRIPPGSWMFFCCECCVLSGRGLCDELITCPEESYRLWCVVVRDLDTSTIRRPLPALGRSAIRKEGNIIPRTDIIRYSARCQCNGCQVLIVYQVTIHNKCPKYPSSESTQGWKRMIMGFRTLFKVGGGCVVLQA
jgi:hypothetical protein